MGAIGKIVGGAIGLALGGPLGAVAGAVFGHAYDLSSEEEETLPHAAPSTGDKAQITFFVAAFSMLAKLSQADGRVSAEEVDSINRFMAEDLNLNPAERQTAGRLFEAALNSPQRFEDFAAQFYDQFQHQPQMLEVMIDILLRVSLADGQLDPREDRLVNAAARIFRLDDDVYGRIRARYVSDVGRHYAVLGASPDDSDEVVKHKYRRKVAEFHPDTIAAKGLPDEFIKFANDKFREIHDAWEAVKKERGLR